MTPEQVKEARKLLGWSRERLGAASGAGANFIRYFEEFGRAAGEQGVERLQAVCAALEAAGVEFTNGNSPGVRLRKADA